jgi:hypothetical protein
MTVFNSLTIMFTKYSHWELLNVLTPWFCKLRLFPFCQPRRTGKGGGSFQLFVLLNLLDRHTVELGRSIGTSQHIYLQRVRNQDFSVRTAEDMYPEPPAHCNGPNMGHCVTYIFLTLCSFLQEIRPCSSQILVSQSLSPSFESHCLSSLTSYTAHDTWTVYRSFTPDKSGKLTAQLIRLLAIKTLSGTLLHFIQRTA